VPLLWDLVVTLTASWQKIFSADPAIGYWTQHHQYLAAKQAGKTAFGSAKNAHELNDVIRNTFIQGTLSILFALVVVIVVIVGLVVSLRAIRGGGRPLAEEDAVPSRRFAPSGLIPSAAERELQRQWDALPASTSGSGAAREH
jgi:carbon starvation protein